MIGRAGALLLALAVLAGCGGSDSRPSAQPSAPTTSERSAVRDVSSVLELRGAFNEDRGSTRLLLVLSPT